MNSTSAALATSLSTLSMIMMDPTLGPLIAFSLLGVGLLLIAIFIWYLEPHSLSTVSDQRLYAMLTDIDNDRLPVKDDDYDLVNKHRASVVKELYSRYPQPEPEDTELFYNDDMIRCGLHKNYWRG